MTAPLVSIYNGIAALVRTACARPVVMGPTVKTGPIVIVHPWVVDDSDILDDADTLIGVQVRIKGDQNEGLETVITDQQAIFDVLHLNEYADYSGITAALTWRQSSTGVALDAGRPDVTDTYYLRGITRT